MGEYGLDLGLPQQGNNQFRRMEELHLSLRLSNAAALLDIGRRDSALQVYLRIFGESERNWRAGIAAARMMTDDPTLGSRPLARSDSVGL